MMADTESCLEFLEGGVRMFLDARLEFFGANAPFWAAAKYR